MFYTLFVAGFLSLVQVFSLPKEVKNKSEEVITWLNWDELVVANNKEKKKIIVDVYTEWCGWCKVMDRQTFIDSSIVAYINEHFHAVKLDAEHKERIEWNGEEFKWIPSGKNGIHSLAYALCDGKMSYPSLVFLNENFERIRISKGFKDAPVLLDELKFAAEEQYLRLNQIDRTSSGSGDEK